MSASRPVRGRTADRVVRNYFRRAIGFLGFQSPSKEVCDGIAVTNYVRPYDDQQVVNRSGTVREDIPGGRGDVGRVGPAEAGVGQQ